MERTRRYGFLRVPAALRQMTRMRILTGKGMLCAAMVVAATAGIAGGYLLHARDADRLPATMPSSAVAANAADERVFIAGPGRLPGLPSAASVSGPGSTSRFAVSDEGELLIDEKTEVLLDQYLSALPPDATAARQERQAREMVYGLPAGAAARALDLMHAYVLLRKAEAVLAQEEDPVGLDEMKAVVQRKIALRRKFFERDAADALFGMREAQQIYGIEVARIAADASLDEEGKRQAVRALHAALPARVAAVEFNRLEDFSVELEMRVAQLRLHGAPDEEIRHLRRQYFGMAEREPEQ